MKVDVQVRGLREVENTLTKIAPNHAKNLIRATIGGVAGEVRDEAKKHVRVEEGDLKKSIKVKRRRGRPGYVRADVVVMKKTGFYWRFLEYGTSTGVAAHGFFFKAVHVIKGDLKTILLQQFAKKLVAKLARERKKINGR